MRAHTPGKHIVLFLFLPVCLVAIGAGMWLRNAEQRAAFAAIEYRKAIDGGRLAHYPLPEFLVDLRRGSDGASRFLRMRISIVLDDESLASSVTRMNRQETAMVERIGFFLREMRPDDFEGTAQMARIKQELLRRANLVLAPQVAADVVIEEIIIQ